MKHIQWTTRMTSVDGDKYLTEQSVTGFWRPLTYSFTRRCIAAPPTLVSGRWRWATATVTPPPPPTAETTVAPSSTSTPWAATTSAPLRRFLRGRRPSSSGSRGWSRSECQGCLLYSFLDSDYFPVFLLFVFGSAMRDVEWGPVRRECFWYVLKISCLYGGTYTCFWLVMLRHE